jgi:hypothetical protein
VSHSSGRNRMALMAASRRRAARRSDLGDSWVVNDSYGDESSPEEDPSLPSEKSVTRPANRSQRHSNSAQSARGHRSSRASSAVPETEFIMPSIHEGQVEGSWINTRRSSNAGASLRKRTSNATSSSSQDGFRPNRRVSHASQSEGSEKYYTSKGDDMEPPVDRVLSLLGYSADWFLDVIGGALKNLRKPISWVIALYLFAGLLVMVQNLLTRSVYSALSPLCRIPGMSLLRLPICQTQLPPENQDAANAPVEFERLMNVQGQFEELLEASAAGVSLPFDMKRSEASIRDLRTLVRASRLNSKQEMLLEFDGFIDTARSASYDLQKFNSHVGRRVDTAGLKESLMISLSRNPTEVCCQLSFRTNSWRRSSH